MFKRARFFLPHIINGTTIKSRGRNFLGAPISSAWRRRGTAALLAFLAFVLEIFKSIAHFVQENKLRVVGELLVFDQVSSQTVSQIYVGHADKTFGQKAAKPGGRI